ncbi:hypothetical protein [Acidianus bottle-shaped virus 3 strain ABV3]|uniref:Uncharacterized protein n=1 Tax=Acidianus bottle-shaped virus 3 strain ABV3 TaxID=1732174 RepID=A0A0N9NXZ6_9VIRU|nr:hypothetical protein AVU00_gp30 [Acidianus bottle-shaped virus 3 strain ABV3]ALG96832.1 hypothetical protein [Acidianus bottle-shaped virus 3 strain ABV3]
MRYADLVFETLLNASKDNRLEQINFPAELDTEHLFIKAKKEGKFWRISLQAKDEVGNLIVKAYNKLRESEGLVRDTYIDVLHFILYNS